MNDQRLIELIRLHPALYKLGDPKYLDSKYKISVWQKIARELELDEKDFNVCKSRWTNIRDQYRKFIKSEKIVTGQSGKTKKKYKYAELLEFLNDSDDDRSDHSNFSSQDNHTLTENEAIKTEETYNISVEESFNDIKVEEDTIFTENDEHNNTLSLPTPTTSHFARKRKASPNGSACNTLMKYMLKNNKKKEEKDTIHPMDAFLNGLSPTLKSFSPYNQHLAKGQIFKIVHDLELQELCQSGQ